MMVWLRASLAGLLLGLGPAPVAQSASLVCSGFRPVQAAADCGTVERELTAIAADPERRSGGGCVAAIQRCLNEYTAERGSLRKRTAGDAGRPLAEDGIVGRRTRERLLEFCRDRSADRQGGEPLQLLGRLEDYCLERGAPLDLARSALSTYVRFDEETYEAAEAAARGRATGGPDASGALAGAAGDGTAAGAGAGAGASATTSPAAATDAAAEVGTGTATGTAAGTATGMPTGAGGEAGNAGADPAKALAVLDGVAFPNLLLFESALALLPGAPTPAQEGAFWQVLDASRYSLPAGHELAPARAVQGCGCVRPSTTLTTWSLFPFWLGAADAGDGASAAGGTDGVGSPEASVVEIDFSVLDRLGYPGRFVDGQGLLRRAPWYDRDHERAVIDLAHRYGTAVDLVVYVNDLRGVSNAEALADGIAEQLEPGFGPGPGAWLREIAGLVRGRDPRARNGDGVTLWLEAVPDSLVAGERLRNLIDLLAERFARMPGGPELSVLVRPRPAQADAALDQAYFERILDGLAWFESTPEDAEGGNEFRLLVFVPEPVRRHLDTLERWIVGARQGRTLRPVLDSFVPVVTAQPVLHVAPDGATVATSREARMRALGAWLDRLALGSGNVGFWGVPPAVDDVDRNLLDVAADLAVARRSRGDPPPARSVPEALRGLLARICPERGWLRPLFFAVLLVFAAFEFARTDCQWRLRMRDDKRWRAAMALVRWLGLVAGGGLLTALLLFDRADGAAYWLPLGASGLLALVWALRLRFRDLTGTRLP